jgi:predicted membrane channel-forming protein YqfA (hemolysin III family)
MARRAHASCEQLIYVFYVVAALSAIGIVAEFAAPKAAIPLAIATLILAGQISVLVVTSLTRAVVFGTKSSGSKHRPNHNRNSIIKTRILSLSAASLLNGCDIVVTI